MKNVNVNAIFTNNDISAIGGSLNIGEMTESIKILHYTEMDKYYIDKITIFTFVSAISSIEDPELTKVYDILWTLNTDIEDPISNVMARDVFNPNKNKIIKNDKAISRCFSNQVCKITIQNREVDIKDGQSQCLVKIYLREHDASDETLWEIHSFNLLKMDIVEVDTI